jgi:ferritin-like metal-binding protein YciE
VAFKTREENFMSNLRETFADQLADLSDAEKQLLKALPKMVTAASHEELKEAFESHCKETENHVHRLEQVFEAIGEKAKARKCKAMQGLVEEAQEAISEEEGDAALICAAQKVEHYEIAGYGSVCSWAKLLGEHEAAEILGATLEEEKAADEKLNVIAESAVNLAEKEQPAAGAKPV